MSKPRVLTWKTWAAIAVAVEYAASLMDRAAAGADSLYVPAAAIAFITIVFNSAWIGSFHWRSPTALYEIARRIALTASLVTLPVLALIALRGGAPHFDAARNAALLAPAIAETAIQAFRLLSRDQL